MIWRLSWPLCLFLLDATMDNIHLYMKCHGSMIIYSEAVTDYFRLEFEETSPIWRFMKIDRNSRNQTL